MASFDLLSQLFGSKEGHELNVKIDTIGGVLVKSAGTEILQAVGLPTTVAGAIGFIENAITTQIDGLANLTAQQKSDLLSLINDVFGAITAPATTPAPAPALAVVKETPVFPTVPEGQQR